MAKQTQSTSAVSFPHSLPRWYGRRESRLYFTKQSQFPLYSFKNAGVQNKPKPGAKQQSRMHFGIQNKAKYPRFRTKIKGSPKNKPKADDASVL
jgi:hypothetical protein